MTILVIRNPIETAGLKCAIETFPKRYTAIATPIKGAIAMKGMPKIPSVFCIYYYFLSSLSYDT